MNHRRSYSDSDVKALDVSDEESVSSSDTSIHTVDLYTGWRLPAVSVSVNFPGWFVLLVTLLLFRGPSPPPSCAE